MITTQTMPKTILRQIRAKVELYEGSTLLYTFNYNDFLKSIEVDRAGEENKVFGFTIGQKAVIKVIDRNNEFDIYDTQSLKIYFDNGQGYLSPFPTLYVSEVVRDTTTKELTITAVCAIQKRGHLPVSLIETDGYDPYEFLGECSMVLLGENKALLKNIYYNEEYIWNDVYYEQGANFQGTETIREALTALAEITGSIIYMDCNDWLVLRCVGDTFDYEVNRAEYFTFTAKGSVAIASIAHITELGDNVSAGSPEYGATQYIYNNPFLEMREDVATILEEGVIRIENWSYEMFELNMRGNYFLEPGDYIVIEKGLDNSYIYLFNDSIKYSGGLSQKIFFNYKEQEKQSANPTTIKEAINMTSARVDKVNKEIELLVSEQTQTNSKVAALEMNTGSIVARVEEVENNVNDTVEDLTKKVEATMSAEDVKLEIKSEIAGINKIETSTGYTFNENGLTVSKSNSEMKTTITDDGMTVYKNNTAVLEADNEGVKAIDLHATTFLIIGKNSRLEDYEGNRTACYWIGG
jgi:hypothetical protein